MRPGVARRRVCEHTGAEAQQKVVIYSSNDDTLHKLVFPAFTQETGIAVEPVSAGSGVVVKRIQTEKDRPGGDIVWGISRSLLETNKQFFSPYRSKNHDATPAEYREPTNLWIGNNLHLIVVLQNTKVLPEDAGTQRPGAICWIPSGRARSPSPIRPIRVRPIRP